MAENSKISCTFLKVSVQISDSVSIVAINGMKTTICKA
jgi:hypothetical protein